MKRFFRFKTVILLFIAFIFSTIFTSCSNSMDDVVSSYNSRYQQGTMGTSLANGIAPGEAGFVESEMLAAKYDVRNNGTLNLFAPPRCNSYSWELVSIQTETTKNGYGQTTVSTIEKNVSFILSNGTTKNTREFVLYVPTSKLESGSYKITLTVTDKEGNKYTDSCLLLVYQPLS